MVRKQLLYHLITAPSQTQSATIPLSVHNLTEEPDRCLEILLSISQHIYLVSMQC
jgi:hypothetical protein